MSCGFTLALYRKVPRNTIGPSTNRTPYTFSNSPISPWSSIPDIGDAPFKTPLKVIAHFKRAVSSSLAIVGLTPEVSAADRHNMTKPIAVLENRCSGQQWIEITVGENQDSRKRSRLGEISRGASGKSYVKNALCRAERNRHPPAALAPPDQPFAVTALQRPLTPRPLSLYRLAQRLRPRTSRSWSVWCFALNAVPAPAYGPNSTPRSSPAEGRPYSETFPSASAPV